MSAAPTLELVKNEVDEKAAEVQSQVAAATAQAEAMQVRDQAEADMAATFLRDVKRRRSAAEAERKRLKEPILEAGRRIDQTFKDAMAPFDAADKIVRGKLGTYTAEQERIRREEEERLERERQERERKAREARERQEAEERQRREQAEREQREAEEEAAKAKSEADREAAEALAAEAARAAEEASVAESAIASLPEVQMPKAVVAAPPKQEGISTRKVWKAEVIDDAAVPRDYLVVDEKAIRAAVKSGVREIPGVRIYSVDEMAVRG